MRLTLLLLALCLLTPLPSAATPPSTTSIKEINIITGEWERYTEKDGSGYYFDVLRAIYEPLGIALKIKHIPFIRGFSLLQSGDYDVFLGVNNGLFETEWYSSHPLETDQLSILIHASLEENWEGVESLKILRSAGRPGDFSYRDFNIGKNHIEVNDSDAMIKMLVAGRIDAAIDYELSLISSLKKVAPKNNFIIKNSNFKNNLYFIFYPSEKGLSLQSIFDREMIKLRQSGKLRELMIKNLGDDNRYPQD
jgi:polar amino acid transport system substrate-binding protein